MPRPSSVLDGGRSGIETVGLPELLQQIPSSCGAEGTDSDRNARIQGHELQIVSLAETLSRLVPNTNGRMSANSPRTRYSMQKLRGSTSSEPDHDRLLKLVEI